MSSISRIEYQEELPVATRDMHKAIVSLMEELEEIDCYNQRADACKDTELKTIFMHNRDDEKKHASMLLEWIQRNDTTFSAEMKRHLFTKKPDALE